MAKRPPPVEAPPGTLAAQLAGLLKAKGMTPRQVADRSGLSVDAIRNLLQQKATAPRATTLQKIADALGVPSFDLMAGFAGQAAARPLPPEGWVDVPQLDGLDGEEDSLFDLAPSGHWRLPLAALAAKRLRPPETVIVCLASEESPVHRIGDYLLIDAVPGLLPPRRGGWVVLREPGYGYRLAEYRKGPGNALERKFALHDGAGRRIKQADAKVVGLVVGKMLP